jgi:tetratricopeptide (TPR) repeat protein
LLEESLATYQALDHKLGMANTLYSLCWITSQQQRYDEARSSAEASLALYQELDHQPGIAEALIMLGFFALAQNAVARASTLFEQSLTVAGSIGSKRAIAHSQYWLGVIAFVEGESSKATPLVEEALAVFRELGDSWGLLRSLLSLGSDALEQQLPLKAAPLLEEALAMARKVSNPVYIALASRCIGWAAWLQGDGARAVALHKMSLELYREIQDRWGIAECLEGLAELSSAQATGEMLVGPGDMQSGRVQAVRLFAAAAALRESTGNRLGSNDQIRYQRCYAALAAELGEALFAATWEAGQALPLEQAIDQALTMSVPGESQQLSVSAV